MRKMTKLKSQSVWKFGSTDDCGEHWSEHEEREPECDMATEVDCNIEPEMLRKTSNEGVSDLERKVLEEERFILESSERCTERRTVGWKLVTTERGQVA